MDLNIFIFTLNITGLTISLSLMDLFNVEDIILIDLIALSSLLFSSLIIYTVPRFSHSTHIYRYTKKLTWLFILLSALFFLLNLIFYFVGGNLIIRSATLIVMTLSIIYSMIYMISPGIKKGKKKDLGKYTKRIGISTVLIMPVIFMLDLFPNLIPFNSSFTGRMNIIPGFYLFLNLFLIFSLKGKFWNEDEDKKSFLNTNGISPRESEVMDLLISGYSYQNIANSLNISLSTVKTHISKIYQKSGITNKVELIKAISQK